MKLMVTIAWSILLTFSAVAGWYMESTTTVDGEGESKGQFAHKARVWISDDNMKMEFAESRNPMMPAGTYMVSRDGGKTMTLVNPANKTYAEFDIAAMAGMAMEMMGGMMKMTNQRVEKLADEDGGRLLGQPVRYFKYRSGYDMEINLFGMRQISKTENLHEVWAAPKIDFGAGFMAGAQSFKSGNESFDKMIEAEMAVVKGMPLKQVTINRATEVDGSTSETKTTMVVTKLEERTLPASAFAIPEGYTATSFMAMGLEAGRSSGRDDDEDSNPGLPPDFDMDKMMEMLKQLQKQ